MEEKHPENCKQMFALLSEYLDHEMAPKSCEELEQHLKDCPPCIEFLESLKRSVRVCKECGPSETPPPMTAGEKAQLQAAYRKFRRQKDRSQKSEG